MNSNSSLLVLDDPAALGRALEAILFVAEGPVELSALAQATGAVARQVEAALAHLGETLQERGLRLQRSRDRVQLVTAPEHAVWIERFLGLDLSAKLSAAALETLAIIAYRQPMTRPEVEAVRGVNSSGTIRTLLQRELIEEAGRLETVGNPYLYATTGLFLQYFGLASLEELPPLAPDEAAKLLTALAETEADGGSAVG